MFRVLENLMETAFLWGSQGCIGVCQRVPGSIDNSNLVINAMITLVYSCVRTSGLMAGLSTFSLRSETPRRWTRKQGQQE